MAKHFDNKNDILKTVRKQKMENEMLMAAAHTAYMRMGLLTLIEDFGFDTEQCEQFNEGIFKRLEALDNEETTGSEMSRRILERTGIYVEDPKLPDWVTDRMLR